MGCVWLPGEPAFCALIIWAGALVGAEIARWVGDAALKSGAGALGGGLSLGRANCLLQRLHTGKQCSPSGSSPNRVHAPSGTPARTRARRAQLRVPRVVGMLGAGLLLANVPGGAVAAFPARWGVQMRAAALATIFLRCGLELEFKVGDSAVEVTCHEY